MTDHERSEDLTGVPVNPPVSAPEQLLLDMFYTAPDARAGEREFVGGGELRENGKYRPCDCAAGQQLSPKVREMMEALNRGAA